MHRSVCGFLGTVALAALASPCLAQGETPPLDLAAAVRLALQHQPRIAGAEGSAAAAAQAARVRAAELRPHLHLEVADLFTGTRGGELDFVSRDAPREAVGQVVVDQVLYDREEARRVRAAEADAAAARAGTAVTRLEVAETVAEAYYGVLAREAAVAVWDASRDQAERLLGATREALGAGTRARLDLLRAQLVAQNAEQGLAVARVEAASAAERLRLLTGLDELGPLAEPARPDASLELASLDALAERAARLQPRLEQLRSGADREAALLAAARARRWPRARFEAAGGWDTAAIPWHIDPGWSAGLFLSMPLYDGGAIAASKEGARFEVEAAQAAYRQALLDLREKLAKARGEAEAALAEYRAAETAASTREEIARISGDGYRAGRLSSLDVAAAEEDLVKGRLERVSVSARLHLALARLEILTGELPGGGSTP